MEIFIVRHTEYDNPKNIYPIRLPLYLSRLGRNNAKRIGLWFKKNKSQKLSIYSSPVVRTLQTAEIIASYINSFVFIDSNLIEVRHGLQGKPIPKNNPWGKDVYNHPTMESQKNVLRRMVKAYKDKVTTGKNCILVTHGDHITLLWHYLKGDKFPIKLWLDKHYVAKGEILKIILRDKKVINIERIII